MASTREHQRINPKHQSGHFIPKDSIRYEGHGGRGSYSDGDSDIPPQWSGREKIRYAGHGGRGSYSDGDSDIPPKWSGREKMICNEAKVTPPKKDYDIHPYAEVDVKIEVESDEYEKKTTICAEVVMMNVGFKEPTSGPEIIPSGIGITLDLKGDAARHCHGRPTMEPHLVPTVNDILRNSTYSVQIPVDCRHAAVGYQTGTSVSSANKPTFIWTSAPFKKHDSTSAEFNMTVKTYENGERIVPGEYRLGSVPKLPLQGHGYSQLFKPGSSLCKARWTCDLLPTNLKTVELGIEVKLSPTIFRARRRTPFYSVTEGHLFTYNKDLTFTRPQFSHRDIRAQ